MLTSYSARFEIYQEYWHVFSQCKNIPTVFWWIIVLRTRPTVVFPSSLRGIRPFPLQWSNRYSHFQLLNECSYEMLPFSYIFVCNWILRLLYGLCFFRNLGPIIHKMIETNEALFYQIIIVFFSHFKRSGLLSSIKPGCKEKYVLEFSHRFTSFWMGCLHLHICQLLFAN